MPPSRRYNRPGPAPRTCRKHPGIPAASGKDLCHSCLFYEALGKERAAAAVKAALVAGSALAIALGAIACGASFPVPNTVTVQTGDGSVTVCTTIPADKLLDGGGQ